MGPVLPADGNLVRALIVSEGRSRAALAAARALGRAGWRVGIGSPVEGCLSAVSRYASAWHHVPLPEESLDGFLRATRRAVDAGGYEVVFGTGDAEILAMSWGRDRIGAVVPYAGHETVVRAIDKLALTEAAARAGLAVPETVPATGRELARFGLPALVKGRFHWLPGLESAPPRLPATIVRTRRAMAERAEELRGSGGEPLLQELVQGSLVSLATLLDGDGDVVAQVQQVAHGVWPLPAGGGVRQRTVTVDEELAKRVAGMLADMGWFGLAQVQFLMGGDGEPRLIDLNGRFYGSLALAVASGPNLPDLWARLATGRSLPPVPPARVGVRFHWLEGDLRRAREERRGGLVRDVLSTLGAAPGAVHSIIDPADPKPLLNHLRHLAGLARRKLWRRLLRRG
jgi:predicted ATP-grasp superfamily ATP-dependent carboligase